MKKATAVIVVVVVLVLILGSSFVSRRNQMVQKNETVKASWSEVDVQLQRRADLIPNLVATVKGYTQHEETVFDNVAAARAALLNARTPSDRIAANGQLDGAIGRLLAIVENYPQLKANENFLQLQDELAGTENRIAVARRRYNETLRDYNAYIGLFPNNVAAGWAGFQRNNAYFNAAPGAEQAPRVNFQFPASAPAPNPPPVPTH
ncbi:MAG TPA: LemA family protein [Candidatus Acidoferrales bacterium]|nr:LemA family protein [Candidatus Acidoferrales bacterium]